MFGASLHAIPHDGQPSELQVEGYARPLNRNVNN